MRINNGFKHLIGDEVGIVGSQQSLSEEMCSFEAALQRL